MEARPFRPATRADLNTIAENAKLSWAQRDYERISAGKWQALRDKKKREHDLDELYEQFEEEADEREAREANLKRFDEACFQLTAFRPNEDLNRDRLGILWGRDQKLTIEFYRKLIEEDGRRVEKARLTKLLTKLDSPPPPPQPSQPPPPPPRPMMPPPPPICISKDKFPGSLHFYSQCPNIASDEQYYRLWYS